MTHRKRRSLSMRETDKVWIDFHCHYHCYSCVFNGSYIVQLRHGVRTVALVMVLWVAWAPGDGLNKACVLDTWGTNLSD